jgi:hypothetical protein
LSGLFTNACIVPSGRCPLSPRPSGPCRTRSRTPSQFSRSGRPRPAARAPATRRGSHCEGLPLSSLPCLLPFLLTEAFIPRHDRRGPHSGSSQEIVPTQAGRPTHPWGFAPDPRIWRLGATSMTRILADAALEDRATPASDPSAGVPPILASMLAAPKRKILGVRGQRPRPSLAGTGTISGEEPSFPVLP